MSLVYLYKLRHSSDKTNRLGYMLTQRINQIRLHVHMYTYVYIHMYMYHGQNQYTNVGTLCKKVVT